MANDFDPTQQVILQTIAGLKVWLAEFSAIHKALFLPTGALDFPLVDATDLNPPPGRVRIRYNAASNTWESVDEAGAVTTIGSFDSKPTAISVENPSATERIVWFRTYAITTINEVNAVLNGSSTPSVTFEIRFAADRSALGTEILTGGRTLTNTTTGVSYTPDVTVIPADQWVWLETTARSGTVLEMNVAMDLTP